MTIPTPRRLEAIARAAMLQRGLLPDFSTEALAQLKAIDEPARPHDGLRELRGLLWASIDNDDSLDLDQLSVSEALAGGSAKILVAVADVDAVVRQNTAIDVHARTNTTSVYTAAIVFPMLPVKLSTNLTSLNENRDRLAVVTELVFDAEGQLTRADLYRALVRNRAKLAYDSVAAWLDGRAAAPPKITAVPGLDAQLRQQDAVAQKLKALRHQRGALTLQTIEARAVFEGEELVDLRADTRNRAKELIEEFMVAANGASARFLESHGSPSMRRVLRSPERWARIVALAAALKEALPAEPDAGALEAFLSKRSDADPGHFPDLSLSVVKLLGRGEYLLEVPGVRQPGHFGLAVKDYTHSTAPNRRFPDLLTQRLIKAALVDQPPPYELDTLNALAQHCTAQEDAASKVERQVRKSAAALLLGARIGQVFEGIVTGASAKGTWVRVTNPEAEGMVVRGAIGLDVGDTVKVRLLHTDVDRGFIDFERVEAA